MPTTDTPKFDHDCKHCRFLDHRFGRDIYVCRENIVIRRGNKGEKYASYYLAAVKNFLITSSDKLLQEMYFGRQSKDQMALNFALFTLALEGREK